MNTMSFSSRLRGIIILFAIFASWPVLAQDVSGEIAAEEPSIPEQYEARLANLPADPEFSELREIRNGIVQEIPILQTEIDTVRSELAALRQRQATLSAEVASLGVREREQLERVNMDIRFFQDEIKAIEEQLADSATPQLEARRNHFSDQLRGAGAEADRLGRSLTQSTERAVAMEAELKNVQDGIDAALVGLAEKNRDMMSLREIQSRIDDRINVLLIPETAQNEFKLWVTAAFSVLVGIVIIGFFVIAGRDETVRQSIFSSQSGIQFLTLFSLVIAIILFGITGILEGKELSALLGGLSGYILGRVGSSMDQAGRATPKPPTPEGPPAA